MRRSAASTPPCMTTASKNGDEVSAGLGGFRGAGGAPGGQGEAGDAPTDAPANKCLVLLDDPGSSRSPDPHLTCARPRCLFRCRRVAATALGPAVSDPSSLQSFGGSRCVGREGRRTRRVATTRHETVRHDMVRSRRPKNRLGFQSGFRLRPPDQQAAATMPPHAPTCPADTWCISQSAVPVCSGRLQ